MADIKRGESIFIPFRNGTSIFDSQCKPRMYKTIKGFEKYFPGHYRGNDGVELVEYAEVVRCKDCKFWKNTWVAPDGKTEHGYCHMEEADDVIVGRWDDDFCSYGERKDNDSD